MSTPSDNAILTAARVYMSCIPPRDILPNDHLRTLMEILTGEHEHVRIIETIRNMGPDE